MTCHLLSLPYELQINIALLIKPEQNAQAAPFLPFLRTCKQIYALRQKMAGLEHWNIPNIEEPVLNFLVRTRRLGDFKAIMVLGESINSQDRRGVTPLHIAAKHGLINFVSVILKHPKVDVSIKMNNKLAIDLTENQEIKNLLLYKNT